MSNRSRKAIVEFSTPSSSSSAQSGGRRRRNQSISNQPETIPEEEQDGRSNDCAVDENSTEFKLATNDCVRYILMHEHTKQYVKQSDINHLLKDHHTLGRDYINEVMKSAAQQLFKEFGLRLIEVPNASCKMFILHTIYTNDLIHLDEAHSNDNEENDDDFDYDLTDILDNIPSDYEDLPPNDDDLKLNDLSFDQVLDSSKSTLLLIVLSFILLEETQSLSEEDLFRNLKEIGLSLDTKIENFHDSSKITMKELISKEFVRQNYLKRNKVSNLDANAPTEYNYEWAFRAEVEFKKTDVLNFVKSIYDGNQAYLNQLETKCQAWDLERAKVVNGGDDQEAEDGLIFVEPMVTTAESESTFSGGRKRSGTQKSSRNSAPTNSTPRPSTRNSETSHVETLADESMFDISQINPPSMNRPSSSLGSTAKKPGRPPKSASKTPVSSRNQTPIWTQKRGRGRPKKG